MQFKKKIHTHPTEGDLKVKNLEAKYEANLEFPGGTVGVGTKNLPWGEVHNTDL